MVGAFTGAQRRMKGRFELADGGTIFLDEIGEMPLHLQVDLLSVLQRRRVQRVGSDRVTGITDEALDALIRYRWPGNVRQLLNAIEHSLALCVGNEITLADLPDSVAGRDPASEDDHGSAGSARSETEAEGWLDQPLRPARAAAALAFERAYLEGLLRRHEGRVGKVAEAAGISARSLYGKLQRHELRKDDYR
ncbi:Limonene hydroxylase [Planctomycetes bacterium Pla86]|uniref:Limonene hydroxylase n=2 Tax=Engelhardtia mirabilis TaxID=2528011 RepID=A0A518BLW5_9BACT|nr:Limonene hydroxylase [Planctomycetes bacterium Pla133]QDV02290.1 Limonene hydroxylase [Planctomycetes bacterium Pla86]